MIALAIMVMVSAILGTFAMALIFDPKVVNANLNEYISNGAYMAFQKIERILSRWWLIHVHLFMV